MKLLTPELSSARDAVTVIVCGAVSVLLMVVGVKPNAVMVGGVMSVACAVAGSNRGSKVYRSVAGTHSLEGIITARVPVGLPEFAGSFITTL